MSPKNLGQLFQIGISGTHLTPEEKTFIEKNNIGSIILFDRNLDTPEQIYELCEEIQSLKSDEDLPRIISIDMEGGRVHRLNPPFTQWPCLKKLGDINSTSMTFKFGQSMGIEMKAVGINLDYAPCIDILTNDKNTVIGDRSIGSDPQQVATIGSALTRGYIKSDILTCAKHFPGHGNTLLDSHFELPIEEDLDLETLRSREFVPYKKTIRSKVDFIMTAHITYKKIDPDHPATFSQKIIKEILNEELRFKGIVISDDLDMKAIRNHYAIDEIPVLALKGGCNMLLYCNEPDIPPIAIESVLKEIKKGDKEFLAHLNESYQKIISLKKSKLANQQPLPFMVSQTLIGHPDHKKLAEAITNGEQIEV